jgi:hypothetical protein
MAIGVFDDLNSLEEDSTQLEHAEIKVRKIVVVGAALLVLTIIYTNRCSHKRII